MDGADLIVLGIQGPEKENDETNDNDDASIPAPVLVGKTKELDDKFGGGLTDLLNQHYKEFKHGGKANGTTPMLTIVANGGKVSKIVSQSLPVELQNGV